MAAAGQIISDFHLCQSGATSNTRKCSNNEVLQSSLNFKDAIETLTEGGVLTLKPGLYGGSNSCDVMLNASNVIIRGSPGPDKTVIDCNFHSRHLTILGDNATITDIHFVRGSSNKSNLYSNHGGCILILGTATVVLNSTFVDCHAEAGGAVFASQSIGQLIMQNVTISNSAASLGAGIFSYGSLHLENCDFYGNNANLFGGAIYIFNKLKLPTSRKSQLQLTWLNTFSKNAAPYGGAIYVDGGVIGTLLLISDTAVFTKNQAKVSQVLSASDFCTWCQGKGGGVHAVNFVTVRISGFTSIQSNEALQGGGIYLDKTSNLDIHGRCDFTNNIASIGGAIFVGDFSVLSISGRVEFKGNEAIIYGSDKTCKSCSSYGGSVYAGYRNVSVNITGNVIFSGNRADYGGAVYSEGYGLHISFAGNTSFLSNNAISGGAWFISMDQAFHATISNDVHMTNNQVTNSGGGIYATGCGDADSGCLLHINDRVAFFENLASGWGGAIRATGSLSIVLKGQVQFMRNLAEIGGAISLEGSVSGITPTATLDVLEQTTFSWNTANTKGGALHSETGVSVFLAGNTLFSNNYAVSKGGGLLAEHNSRLLISENVRLISNRAGGSGGAIFVDGGSTLTMSNLSSVVGNQAENGGGISAEHFSNLTLSGYLNLTNNKALSNGGALYLAFGARAWFSNKTSISLNTAEGDGGGIYLEIHSTINIFGSELCMDKNFARESGGAIFARKQSSVAVIGASLKGNSAGNGGAVGLSFSSVLQVNNSEFLDNSAFHLGGAISVSMKSSLFIGANSTLVGNEAPSGGCIALRWAN